MAHYSQTLELERSDINNVPLPALTWNSLLFCSDSPDQGLLRLQRTVLGGQGRLVAAEFLSVSPSRFPLCSWGPCKPMRSCLICFQLPTAPAAPEVGIIMGQVVLG